MNSERNDRPDVLLSGDLKSIKSLTLMDRNSGIILRPFVPTDESLERMVAWESDDEIRRYYKQESDPQRPETIVSKMRKKYRADAIAGFDIVVAGGAFVGYIDAVQARVDRTVHLGIIIGEKDYWGQKIGGVTMQMLLLCLGNIGIRYAYADMYTENKRSLRLFSHFADGPPVEVDVHTKSLRVTIARLDFSQIDLVAWTGQ